MNNDTEGRYSHGSTGALLDAGHVQALVDEAYQRFAAVTDGANSTVYPALEQADPNQFGICVVGTVGGAFEAGYTQVPFTIMSVAKHFVFALVCEQLGPNEVQRLIGVNATGLAFNSLAAVERGQGGHTNPMVNSRAMATTSLGATLASGGVNPITKARVIDASTCHDVLAVMTIAGLYETSGDWLYQVGLPGKGGLTTFSPPLDAAGNSVHGQKVARYLSRELGLDLFVSAQPS